MHTEVQPAFVSRDTPLEVTVNFGVLAGRDVERREIEALAEQLSPLVSGVTVIAGHRYEFSVGAAEVSASEVTARFDDFLLPTGRAEHDAFVEEIVATINRWALAAAVKAPAAGEDLASRLARETAYNALDDARPA